MTYDTFLQDLAVVVIVAGLVTILFHRLNQPVVLGYLLAGFIIGPNTPPFSFVQDQHIIELLAELGVVFLLFDLGLRFSLRKLSRVGTTAIIAAILEILLMLLIGYGIGLGFGWERMDSLFLGAILAISSTTIIVKALQDLGLSRERFAEIIFGILIVEDILAIAIIALLSGVAVSGSLQLTEVLKTLWQLGLFLVVVLVVGLIAVPRLLHYVSRFKSDEILLITALGLCFGVSLLALKLGYSVALGRQVWLRDEHGHVGKRFELREQVFKVLVDAGVDMPFETIQLAPLAVSVSDDEQATTAEKQIPSSTT
jgi:CPA2 family monovalent cation:H+ antiporter-2